MPLYIAVNRAPKQLGNAAKRKYSSLRHSVVKPLLAGLSGRVEVAGLLAAARDAASSLCASSSPVCASGTTFSSLGGPSAPPSEGSNHISGRISNVSPAPTLVFGPRTNHPASFSDDPLFAAFRALNDPIATATKWQTTQPASNGSTGSSACHKMTTPGARRRLTPAMGTVWFTESSPTHRLARALAEAGAIDVKELFEAFEFYERVRKRVRAPCMLDLACGHGLAGVVFAALERSVHRVVLLDTRRTVSLDTVLRAAASVAPWVLEKVEFVEADLMSVATELQGMTGLQECRARGRGHMRSVNSDRRGHDMQSSRFRAGGGDNEMEQGEEDAQAVELARSACSWASQRRRVTAVDGVSSSNADADNSSSSCYGSSDNGDASCTRSSNVGTQGQGNDQTLASSGINTIRNGRSCQKGIKHAATHDSQLFTPGGKLADLSPSSTPGAHAGCSCGVISIHACGGMTDAALLVATALRAPIAAMPCCYSGMAHNAPLGIRRAMGVAVAADIDRSYRMAAAGYDVDWTAIPRAVTPMNRILLATPQLEQVARVGMATEARSKST